MDKDEFVTTSADEPTEKCTGLNPCTDKCDGEICYAEQAQTAPKEGH